MVDWDRVEELRSEGRSWEQIAADAQVGFHADPSAGNPGHALRARYRRRRSSTRSPGTPKRGTRKAPPRPSGGSPWTLLRLLYLLVPLVGVWFVLAFAVPSPIGLLVPAIPYLALLLTGAAVALVGVLWRGSERPRWSPVFRITLIGGVVLGLVVSGLIGLTGSLGLGCPFLPPASSLTPVSSSGWFQASAPPWQEHGAPVLFSLGATWCPYCSASSWAEWKALSFFGRPSGTTLEYSSGTDHPAQVPEIVLAHLTLGPKNGHAPGVSAQILEDTSNVVGNLPGTASCVQQAYVSSFSNGIPFVVVNGQYVHRSTLVDPTCLGPWANGQNGGAAAVQASVASELPSTTGGGDPWTCVSAQAYWTAAMIAAGTGMSTTTLRNSYGWSATDTAGIQADLNQMR